MTNKKQKSERLRRYVFVEHTADIAIKAYGDTLEEAFATAAQAMFDIITDRSNIESKEEVSFETESVDAEGLLVGFLSQLILMHEVEGYGFTDFEVFFVTDHRLKVNARGVMFDKDRHRYGHHIKGVSYHMMEIVEADGDTPCFVQVLFDV